MAPRPRLLIHLSPSRDGDDDGPSKDMMTQGGRCTNASSPSLYITHMLYWLTAYPDMSRNFRPSLVFFGVIHKEKVVLPLESVALPLEKVVLPSEKVARCNKKLRAD